MRLVGALLLGVIVTLLLRSTALTALAARGMVLDVLAFATVLWSLRNGESWGAAFGFALGIAADLDAAHWLGRHALVLTLIGYGVGRLSHTLVRDSTRAQATLLLFATLVHQVWVAAFELGVPNAWPYLVQRVLLAVVATTLAGTVFVGLTSWIGGRPVMRHASVESDASE